MNQELENNLVELIYKLSKQKLILISAAMGKGLDVLLDQVWKQLGE